MRLAWAALARWIWWRPVDMKADSHRDACGPRGLTCVCECGIPRPWYGHPHSLLFEASC
jgi:hypothetical protein